ncbi:hypothetical protein ACLMJK_004959 [Lecanora helva]
MAALRQLLNARALAASQDRSSPSPTDEEQRRTDAKMQAMGYSNPPPAVPSKSQSVSKPSPEQQRQLHSRFNEPDNQRLQHPLLRKNPSNSDLSNTYNRGNSFDHPNSYNRPQPARSQTETNLLAIDAASLETSSVYDDDSPALSPALNRHLGDLALRPHNTSAPAQNQNSHTSPQKSHTRRRSRSATQDGYYGAPENAWDGYGSNTSKGHKPRQDSLQGPKPLKVSSDTEQNGVMQLLRDRQVRSPEQPVRSPLLSSAKTPKLTSPKHQNRFDPPPLDLIGAKSPNDGRARKEAHTFTNTSTSPTSSVTSSTTSQQDHRRGGNPHKRKRSLDYTPSQLSTMDYSTLATESFDHIPAFPSSDVFRQQHNLPAPTLPLRERLHYIYPDKTHKDKAHTARVFFASLPIDQYEECGDLLLDGFKDIMERLKQARQQKRKACRGMEEEVAKREEWVRRKRGVLEVELARLKGAGTAVVKPAGKKPRGKGSI